MHTIQNNTMLASSNITYWKSDHGLLIYTAVYVTFEGAKLRSQFFKTTWQSEDRDLYYVLVGLVYSAIILPKRQNQSTSRTMLKNFNMKNIKMRRPAPLLIIYLKRAVWYCI